MTHIYASIAYVLRENEGFLLNENASFRHLVKRIRDLRLLPKPEQDVNHINFYIQKAAKRKFKSRHKFRVPPTLAEELEIFRAWLHPDSEIEWACPMGHLFPRTPLGKTRGDACLHGGGGYSIKLRFWWHLAWPMPIVRRTKLHLENNKSGKLISINVLEFIAIIINYAAAYTAILQDGCDDPHPVIFNETDSTNAASWANQHCKSSLAGRALGRLFCLLLVNSPVGVNSSHIKGEENVVADFISRLKLANDERFFNYSQLKQKFPQLKPCRLFQPRPELLSLIYRCVLTQKSPSPEQIRTLKQQGLGKLIG